MYTKNRLIIFWKIKNVIFAIAGVFGVVVSTHMMITLFVHYKDDIDTALNAKSVPGTIGMFVISLAIVLLSTISSKFIGDANFYSSYFENDLDGVIEYADLAKVTGTNVHLIKFKLVIFRAFYMKDYSLKGRIVLKDKKCICECRSCGSVIEKSVYFTGICPACHSSDVFAKVLSGNHFYCIEQEKSDAKKTPKFYRSPKMNSKIIITTLLVSIGFLIVFIVAMVMFNEIKHYNDENYIIGLIMSGEGPSTIEANKEEILEHILFDLAVIVGFWQVLYSGIKRMGMIRATTICSEYFAKRKTPFVKLESLPPVKKWVTKRMGLNAVRGAVRRRYLVNCTFEIHKDKLMLVLAKKIVKDKCPSCGGPITGVVNEHYKCSYCNRTIMYTISKK